MPKRALQRSRQLVNSRITTPKPPWLFGLFLSSLLCIVISLSFCLPFNNRLHWGFSVWPRDNFKHWHMFTAAQCTHTCAPARAQTRPFSWIPEKFIADVFFPPISTGDTIDLLFILTVPERSSVTSAQMCRCILVYRRWRQVCAGAVQGNSHRISAEGRTSQPNDHDPNVYLHCVIY